MKNKHYFWISFALFMLVMAGMLWTEKKAHCGGDIIIPLELAPNIQAFKDLLVPACNLDWIERNTKLDFVFLLTYSATIIFALLGLIQKYPWANKAKPYIALAALPAVLDTIENILLLKFLRADIAMVTSAQYQWYYWCVHLKFALLALILLAIVLLAAKKLLASFQPSNP